jgi:hypothetical protein
LARKKRPRTIDKMQGTRSHTRPLGPPPRHAPMTRKRVPKGLVRLAGSSLPFEVEVPLPQGPPANSGAVAAYEQEIQREREEEDRLEEEAIAAVEAKKPKAQCAHGRRLRATICGSTKIYTYFRRAYYDAAGDWVAIEPADDLSIKPYYFAVADECPACLPYCYHREGKKRARKMIARDIATGCRMDSACPLCNPQAITTPDKWYEFLSMTGYALDAGINYNEISGGGSKSMEEKDIQHSRHAGHGKPAKRSRPEGARTGAGEDDEQARTDDLGMPTGMTYGGNQTPSAANAAAIDKDKKDLANAQDQIDAVVIVSPCRPQRHKDLMKAAKIKKFEAFLCPYCKLEVYAP